MCVSQWIVFIGNYKHSDVGISSNLIGSLSLANGQRQPVRDKLQCETMARINSRSVVVVAEKENGTFRCKDESRKAYS